MCLSIQPKPAQKDGLNNQCTQCKRAHENTPAYRAGERDREHTLERQAQRRDHRLRKLYGPDAPERIAQMDKEQGGLCGVDCKRKATDAEHNHLTGFSEVGCAVHITECSQITVTT